MDWPQKIKEIKEELGCSTSELARRLDIDVHYVGDIERGKSRNPATNFVASLIGKIGVNPTWLFLDEGEILISGTHYETIVEKQRKEIKELKDRLQESNLDVKSAVVILNELIHLKGKDQEKVMNLIRKLNCKD
jgi:transcriptional regulator with XRE-family HTH domain